MKTIGITAAARQLSQLVDAVRSGVESEIILTRNGVPIARLVPLAPTAIPGEAGF